MAGTFVSGRTEGINVEVIDLRTLHLLDKDTILNLVQKPGTLMFYALLSTGETYGN